MIFLEENPAIEFYVLLSGAVQIDKSYQEGKEYTLYHIRMGQMFVEEPYSKGRPSRSTVWL
jgi:CRP-like cAMP-binding protein